MVNNITFVATEVLAYLTESKYFTVSTDENGIADAMDYKAAFVPNRDPFHEMYLFV